MTLFKKPASPAKLKMGIFGGTGSGKTYTASRIIAGLWKLLNDTFKTKKPIYMVDTETGSDYLKEFFKAHKIPFEIAKTRAFPDLLEAVRIAEKEAAGLIIDSETHIWQNFTEGYLKKTNQKFIQLWDWKPLKQEWGVYNDLYKNSDLHIIKCGREANIYETTEEVQGGRTKKVANKVGAKFSSESEAGYEPSLLIQMEKLYKGDSGNGIYVRQAHVVKDRFDIIDSKEFVNPKFEDFLPHISMLDLSGSQDPIDTSRNSEGVFNFEGDGELAKRARRRALLCAEMAGLLNKYVPGTSKEEKQAKARIVEKLFGVYSWDSVTDDWNKVKLERIEEVMSQDGDAPSMIEKELILATEGAQDGGK